MIRPALLAAVLLLVFVAPARAEDPAPSDLTIGSVAPALDIAYWVKGVEMDRRGHFEPVTTFEKGTITVVEFWATWCGPCRAGMPHLSELQERYKEKGVRIIGVSDESLPKVVAFLWGTDHDGDVQNDRTRYTLTTDPDRSTHDAYMKPSEQSGIPTAFVVGKDGRIEWIGHPSRLDPVLVALIEGTWDREAYRKAFEVEVARERVMRRTRGPLVKALRAKDWDGALAVYDEILEVAPFHPRAAIGKLGILLREKEDPKAAYAFADAYAKHIWSDARQLNELAWMIVADKRIRVRELPFAFRVARRAVELSERKDAAVLDTMARVYFEQGKLEGAVAWQTRAAEIASGPLKEQIEKVLVEYRKALELTLGK